MVFDCLGTGLWWLRVRLRRGILFRAWHCWGAVDFDIGVDARACWLFLRCELLAPRGGWRCRRFCWRRFSREVPRCRKRRGVVGRGYVLGPFSTGGKMGELPRRGGRLLNCNWTRGPRRVGRVAT